MSTVLITYRLRAEHVDEHLATLSDRARRASSSPARRGRLDHLPRADGRSFVELVQTDRPGRLSSLDSWPAFRSTLEQRCDQLPEIVELDLVADSEPGGRSARRGGDRERS